MHSPGILQAFTKHSPLGARGAMTAALRAAHPCATGGDVWRAFDLAEEARDGLVRRLIVVDLVLVYLWFTIIMVGLLM